MFDKPSNTKIEEQVRRMTVWQAQAISILKRALRNPGVLQECVLDRGDGVDVTLTVMAQETVSLILPEEKDDA